MKAKKAGMSHDKVKEEQAKDVREQKKLANKDMAFGKKEGLITKDKVMAQRLKDMNDPTTELGKATARAARKAAKEAEEFLLRTKGISIKQKEVPPGVDPKTILCEYFRYGCCAKTAEKCKFSHKMDVVTRFQGSGSNVKRDIYEDDQADEADTMELWDQAKLESVIAKKHGKEANSAPMPPPSCASTSCRRWRSASTGGSGTARRRGVQVQAQAAQELSVQGGFGRDDARGCDEQKVGSGRASRGAREAQATDRAPP